jgi:hypothetical protein
MAYIDESALVFVPATFQLLKIVPRPPKTEHWPRASADDHHTDESSRASTAPKASGGRTFRVFGDIHRPTKRARRRPALRRSRTGRFRPGAHCGGSPGTG